MRRKLSLVIAILIIGTLLLITGCFSTNDVKEDILVQEEPIITIENTPSPEPTPEPTLEELSSLDLSQIGNIYFQKQKTTPVEGCPDTQIQIGDWVMPSMGPVSPEDADQSRGTFSLWIRDCSNKKDGCAPKIGRVVTLSIMEVVSGPLCYKHTIYWKMQPAEGDLDYGWDTGNYVTDAGWVAEADYTHNWLTHIALFDQLEERYRGSDDIWMYLWFLISATDRDLKYREDDELWGYYDQVGRDLFLDYVNMLPVYVEGYDNNPPISFEELTKGAITDPNMINQNSLFMKDPFQMAQVLLQMTLNGTDGEYLYYEILGME